MFTAQALIFTRLAAMSDAGVALPDAFERVAGSNALGLRLREAAKAFRDGADAREALAKSKPFDDFSTAMILAGEGSGRLPESFRALAAVNEQRAQAWVSLAFAMAYPLFLLHFACFAPNFGLLVSNGFKTFLYASLSPLAAFYACVIVPTIAVLVLRQNEAGATAIDRIALSIPLFGSFLRAQQTALSLLMLGHLYGAGIPILRALEDLIRLTSNRCIRACWERCHQRLRQGESLTAAIASEEDLPQIAVDYISTGEQSGKLDELLLKAADSLESEAKTKLRILLAVGTGLAFGLAALFVAYKVITFYLDLFSRAGVR